MPGLLTDDAVKAAGLLVRHALIRLHAALPLNLRPGGHCYALSRCTAALLQRAGFPGVTYAVGWADGSDARMHWPRAPHAWIAHEEQRWDVKEIVAQFVYGRGPRYSNYEPAAGGEAQVMERGFLNACGLAEEVYDLIADECFAITKRAA